MPSAENFRLLIFLLLGGLLIAPARAQNYPRVAPQEPEAAPPATLPAPPSPPPSAANENAVIIPELKGIAFVASSATVKPEGLTAPGVSLGDITLLERDDFRTQVEPFLGRPLTFGRLNEIARLVVAFYRAHAHPLVNVTVPEQNVQSGTVQIVVTEFRVGAVRVEGNKWFSDAQVAAPVTFQPGDTVDADRLLGELDAANANPFRRVDLIYAPGAKPGATDLILQTQDRFPLRVYGSYDNGGTPSTGRARWGLGFNWGKAFGLDSQLAYQFTSSNDFWRGRSSPPGEPDGASFVAHSLNWSLPMPRGGRLALFGAHEESVPQLGPDFGLTGRSDQVSLRYSQPLPRTPAFTHAVEVGYDYKNTNNNLDFGGTTVSANATEIDQFLLKYSANLDDRFGSTGGSATLAWSPGDITSRNTDAAFQPAPGQSGRSAASARYAYLRVELERLTRLPLDATWATRLIGQLTSSNLLSTEQLSVGGPDLLRGYEPNSINGDRGVVLSNELRTPVFHLLPGKNPADRLQALAFWDYAALSARRDVVGDINRVHASSAGLGLRYNLAAWLVLKLDYGWQLQRLPNDGGDGRFGFAAVTVGY